MRATLHTSTNQDPPDRYILRHSNGASPAAATTPTKTARYWDGIRWIHPALCVQAGALTRDEPAASLIELVAGQDSDDSIAQFEACLAVRRCPELVEPVHRIMRGIEEATETALDAFGVADPHILAKQYVALIDGFTLQEIARPGRPESRRALSDLLPRLLA